MLFTCLHHGHYCFLILVNFILTRIRSLVNDIVLFWLSLLYGCFASVCPFSLPYDAYFLQHQRRFNFTLSASSPSFSSPFLLDAVYMGYLFQSVVDGQPCAPPASHFSPIHPHTHGNCGPHYMHGQHFFPHLSLSTPSL
ncbi:hypothetical protein, unlikely [Trypanosoma congolense IL3000]|uniref:Uncharacterized protein n=1 Tax=Trypanosoma congolense (strain IL3000) TaxID=1068625 RepID=F9W4A3_TRYCI|nr:hypothetical protein, unlikely [Trypanosoma congolense IL3000]